MGAFPGYWIFLLQPPGFGSSEFRVPKTPRGRFSPRVYGHQGVCAAVIDVPIGVGRELLLGERLHDARTPGVVIGVSRSAHAGDHVVRLQQGHVRLGCILHAAIGMGNQPRAAKAARGWPAPSDSATMLLHWFTRSTAIRFHAVGYCPTRLVARCSPP